MSIKSEQMGCTLNIYFGKAAEIYKSLETIYTGYMKKTLMHQQL